MKILVTGAKGFVGKNLIWELRNRDYTDIMEYDINSTEEELDQYTKDCDFVFHLAGVNRPKIEEEFMEGNFGFTSELLAHLDKWGNQAPILITSSIQAELDNAYGKSKRAGEELLFAHQEMTGAKSLVYRLQNVFGKWCRPNYNSGIATFCHNIAHGLDICVNDPNVMMNLVYIDDVVDEFIAALNGNENRIGKYCMIPTVHTASLGKIVEMIMGFRESRTNLSVPNMGNELEKKLYSTYLSYLPHDQFSYELDMKKDERGSFTEFLRTKDRGQVSVNISNPGVTKGKHWHHTKNEKFLVVSGEGSVRFRQIDSDEIIEYHVSGEKLEVIDIPTGYTHDISNEGTSPMVTIMWANEAFDPEKPDTYFMPVTEDAEDCK
ncbi:MAG: capsular polysaccharide biosynthesis protein CapF [Clostridia bacterium]|nr:capsular polysaccharide biosynthesis protein CapF [Clostridia bacterium]